MTSPASESPRAGWCQDQGILLALLGRTFPEVLPAWVHGEMKEGCSPCRGCTGSSRWSTAVKLVLIECGRGGEGPLKGEVASPSGCGPELVALQLNDEVAVGVKEHHGLTIGYG